MIAQSRGAYVPGKRASARVLEIGLTGIVVAILAASLVASGALMALGFLCGAALAWASWRSIELVVHCTMRAPVPWRGVLMATLFVLKLPLLVLTVGGAAWLAIHQLVDPFALVVGMIAAESFLVSRGARAWNPLKAPPLMADVEAREGWRASPPAKPARGWTHAAVGPGLTSRLSLPRLAAARHARRRAREG